MANRYRQESTRRAPNAFGSTMADLERRALLVEQAEKRNETYIDDGYGGVAWVAKRKAIMFAAQIHTTSDNRHTVYFTTEADREAFINDVMNEENRVTNVQELGER